MKRVGIFRGTFDPIHAGHVAFALQALHYANLDEVYFLVEIGSRHKSQPEHFAHRYAMIEQAIKQYPKLKLYKVPTKKVTARTLLPRLNRDFLGEQLVFLMGSDVAATLPKWPDLRDLCTHNELIIGMRDGQTTKDIQAILERLPVQPSKYMIIDSHFPQVNSSAIRRAVRLGHPVQGLLTSARRYILLQWLYVSLSE